MHNQRVVIATGVFSGKALFVDLGNLLERSGEWLLFRSQVIKHLVALLIDYSEMVVRSNRPQRRDRLQVCVCIQPLIVMWPGSCRCLRPLGFRLMSIIETRIRLWLLLWTVTSR